MAQVEKNLFKTYNDFPSTRFQGSKKKMLSWIKENLSDLHFETVLDAFGGTGAVSYLFKTMEKEVTYNDSLKFNYIIGRALIQNSAVQLGFDEITKLVDLRKVNSKYSVITETFPDIYFTEEENEWLDKYVARIEGMFPLDRSDSEYKSDLAYFGVFQACLTKRPYNLFHRKNLYMRLSDVKRNFGNKYTWEKPFPTQVEKFLHEANDAVFSNGRSCKALNKNAFEIKNDFDLVYLDPPYVDINGDHDTIDYLYCYHFLEGLVNYANWMEKIDFETKNRRFKKIFHNNEFKKKNVLESFDRLFDNFKDSIIVVSYKKNGVPSITDIENLLLKYKANVRVVSTHYKYALNKQNGNAKHNREVLLIGT